MEIFCNLLSILTFPFRLTGRGVRFLIGPWFELWLVKSYQVELLNALSSAQVMAHDMAHRDEKSKKMYQSLRADLQSLDKRLSMYILGQEGTPNKLIENVKTLQGELRSVIDDAEKNGS